MKQYFLFFLIGGMLLLTVTSKSQEASKKVLSLSEAIALANEASLEAFRIKNLYLSSYWEYRSFKAERLPSLSLNLTPAKYQSYLVERYISELDRDEYRKQQSFYSYGNLSIQQNLDCTGGTFYIDSELGYLRTFGASNATQYSSVPIRIGYSQTLVGYNSFKWEKRIEPLKYERAKKELLYNMEDMAEQATTYFFNLALAEAKCQLAIDNLASCDTLYQMGELRHELAALSKADLLTLNLEKINAENTLLSNTSSKKRAMFSLLSFLNLTKDTNLELKLPTSPSSCLILPAEALQKAKDNNPEFLAQRQNVLEAEQALDKVKKQRYVEASVSASIGFNQVSNTLSKAYVKPMQQDIVSVGLSIPLVDWGVRKGKCNMANNNLNIIKTTAEQETQSVEEEVVMTVTDFNIQQKIVISTEKALDLSILAYNETRERFIIGKTDLNSVTLAHNRQQQAQENFLIALRDYWIYYYKIRKLTLFDFDLNISLANKFDYENYLK